MKETQSVQTMLANSRIELQATQLEARLTGIDRQRIVDACDAMRVALDSPLLQRPITHDAMIVECNRNYDLGRAHRLQEIEEEIGITVAEFKSQRLELLGALEQAAKQFDFTVSALSQGHTVSVSSLQNCAALARQCIAKAKGGV